MSSYAYMLSTLGGFVAGGYKERRKMKEERNEKILVVFTTDDMRRTGSYVVEAVYDNWLDADKYMWELQHELTVEEQIEGYQYSCIRLLED